VRIALIENEARTRQASADSRRCSARTGCCDSHRRDQQRFGEVIAADWFAKAERVHRQLRPALPAKYEAKMRRVFAGGARMCVAVEGGRRRRRGISDLREHLQRQAALVDDLVTDEGGRSTGVGRALLSYLERKARAREPRQSRIGFGTQRAQAHKFYFREGLVATAFISGRSSNEPINVGLLGIGTVGGGTGTCSRASRGLAPRGPRHPHQRGRRQEVEKAKKLTGGAARVVADGSRWCAIRRSTS